MVPGLRRAHRRERPSPLDLGKIDKRGLLKPRDDDDDGGQSSPDTPDTPSPTRTLPRPVTSLAAPQQALTTTEAPSPTQTIFLTINPVATQQALTATESPSPTTTEFLTINPVATQPPIVTAAPPQTVTAPGTTSRRTSTSFKPTTQTAIVAAQQTSTNRPEAQQNGLGGSMNMPLTIALAITATIAVTMIGVCLGYFFIRRRRRRTGNNSPPSSWPGHLDLKRSSSASRSTDLLAQAVGRDMRNSVIWGSTVSRPSPQREPEFGDMVDHDGSTVRGERLGRVRTSLIRNYRIQWTRRPQSFQRSKA